MARKERIQLIENLEAVRGSRVIALVLGDRPGQETRLAADILPLLSRHLREIGEGQDRIDLLLYTLGGEIVPAFRLVGLIREYCKTFTVIVPFRCQSAGTLVALGADRIIMLPEGQLSPVDPSTNGPYNPLVPGAPLMPGAPPPTLPVSVEEVIGYLNLAREEAGIKGEAGLVSVFEKLTSDVRPVALGQVYRARTQIRMLSRKLLELHMGGDDNAATVEGIITTLTEKLYSHDYLITRVEAKKMGLQVESPSGDLEKAIRALHDAYEQDLRMLDRFNPLQELGSAPSKKTTNDRAILESSARLDTFQTEFDLKATPQGIQAQPTREGWVTT